MPIKKKKRTNSKQQQQKNQSTIKETIKHQQQNNTNTASLRTHSSSVEKTSTCILMHLLHEMSLYVDGIFKLY